MAAGGFKTLLRAMRIERTIPGLLTIMVPVSFANKFSIEIFFLCLVGILIYSAQSIFNAKRDNDYLLPNYSKHVSAMLILTAIIFSLSNRLIFLAALGWIFLGFIYNTIARFVLLADVTILSFTHHALPILSSALLLNIDLELAILLSLFMFILFWFIIPIKNLKGVEDDLKRRYTTLATKSKKGILISKIFLGISFFVMLAGYFIFNLSYTYLIFLALALILGAFSLVKINKLHDGNLNLFRLIPMVFLLGIIADKSSNLKILILSFSLFFVYFLISALKFVNLQKVGYGL